MWKSKLIELQACADALEYCKGFDTLQEAWDSCGDATWMAWLLKRTRPKNPPILELIKDILSFEENQEHVEKILSGETITIEPMSGENLYVQQDAVKCLNAWRAGASIITYNEMYMMINESHYPAENLRRFFPQAPDIS